MKKALTVLLLLTAATAFGETAVKTATAPAAAKPQREAAAGTVGSAGTAAGKAASPEKTAGGGKAAAENSEKAAAGEASAETGAPETAAAEQAELPLSAVEGRQLIPYIGSDPRKAFTAFGIPVSLNVLRGEEPSLDDVVSVHDAGVYLFWYRDRVWQIGFGSYFTGTFEGVKIGMKETDLTAKLGKPLLRDEKMIVYEIFHREFPVSMRFVIEQGKVSEMYLYRSDL